MRSLLLAALIGAISCCSHAIVVKDPPIVGAPDGGDLCSRACGKLDANLCPEGLDPNCVTACLTDQAQGAASQLDPQCILDATSLSGIRGCGAPCVGR